MKNELILEEQFQDLSLENFYVDKQQKIVDWKNLGQTLKNSILQDENVENKIMLLFEQMAEVGILRKNKPKQGDYLIDENGINTYSSSRDPYSLGKGFDVVSVYYPVKREDALNIVEHLDFRLMVQKGPFHKVTQYKGDIK